MQRDRSISQYVRNLWILQTETFKIDTDPDQLFSMKFLKNKILNITFLAFQLFFPNIRNTCHGHKFLPVYNIKFGIS